MNDNCTISVNGKSVRVPAGATVAAAMLIADEPCRLTVTGGVRAPLCGMGICMECRANVDGVAHRRTCQLICTPGMEVVTA